MPIPMIETQDIEMLRCQFKAWMEGAEAGASGFHAHDNPYPSRSAAGDAWENGCERIKRCTRDVTPSIINQQNTDFMVPLGLIHTMFKYLDTSEFILTSKSNIGFSNKVEFGEAHIRNALIHYNQAHQTNFNAEQISALSRAIFGFCLIQSESAEMSIIIHSKTQGVFLRQAFEDFFFSSIPTIYSDDQTFTNETEAKEYIKRCHPDDFPGDIEFLTVNASPPFASMDACVEVGVKPWDVKPVEPFKL